MVLSRMKAILTPRFSLAAAFVTLTLCAVGLWYWYRLPFQVERRGLSESFTVEYGTRRSRGPMPQGQACVRSTAWMRRGWNSEPILHGERLSYGEGDLLIGRDHWRDGVLHGDWRRWYSDGHLREEGRFWLGRKDGVWKAYRQDDKFSGNPPRYRYHEVISTWNRGQPAGVWEYRDADDKLIQRLEFKDGKLVGFEELPITPRLAAALTEPSNGNVSFLEQWMQPVSFQIKKVPLPYAFEQFDGGSYAQPLAMTQRQVLSPEGDWELPVVSATAGNVPIKLGKLEVNCQVDQMPALPAAGKILAQHRLVGDYRLGRLWITTPQAAEQWRDTTGISQIQPPRGSDLARAWEREVPAEFVETPLCDVVIYLTSHYSQNSGCKLQFDLRAAPLTPVTANASGQLRHSLGIVLLRAHCRCTLQGETLVIEDLPAAIP